MRYYLSAAVIATITEGPAAGASTVIPEKAPSEEDIQDELRRLEADWIEYFSDPRNRRV
jgi:hypothetical protein